MIATCATKMATRIPNTSAVLPKKMPSSIRASSASAITHDSGVMLAGIGSQRLTHLYSETRVGLPRGTEKVYLAVHFLSRVVLSCTSHLYVPTKTGRFPCELNGPLVALARLEWYRVRFKTCL